MSLTLDVTHGRLNNRLAQNKLSHGWKSLSLLTWIYPMSSSGQYPWRVFYALYSVSETFLRHAFIACLPFHRKECALPGGFFQFYLPNLAAREVKNCHNFLKHVRNP